MTRIKQCSVETISLIKKMFSFLIKEAYRHRFQISCPKYLLRVIPYLKGSTEILTMLDARTLLWKPRSKLP